MLTFLLQTFKLVILHRCFIEDSKEMYKNESTRDISKNNFIECRILQNNSKK